MPGLYPMRLLLNMGSQPKQNTQQTYQPDPTVIRNRLDAENQRQIYDIQNQYLDFNRNRIQELADYQNQLNQLDFASLEAKKLADLENQRNAQSLVYGKGPSDLAQQNSAYQSNLSNQEDYRNKISQLSSNPFNYTYNPRLSDNGIPVDSGFAQAQKAKELELKNFIDEQNKSFSNTIDDYYSSLDQRIQERNKPIQVEAKEIVKDLKKPTESKEVGDLLVSPLVTKKKNFFSGSFNSNAVGLNPEGYQGQSNQI